ncbi:MAG: nitrate- and nitrite sensing domain-containing protein, partial [Sciscionella sp.]
MAKFARRRRGRRSRREIGSTPSGFTQGVDEDGAAPDAERRAGGRLRLRNWRLRSKLAVVLLAPTITALALGGLRLQTELGLVDDYSQVRRQAELNSLVNGVLDSLQLERDLAAGYAANDRIGNIADLGSAEQRTDAAVTNLRNWSGRTATVKPEVRQRYRQALSRLAALGALRATIQNNNYPDVALASSYTDITQYLVNLDSSLSMSGFTDPRTAQAASALGDLANAKEQLAQRNTALIIAAVTKKLPPQQSTNLRSAKARYDAAVADFKAVADPATRGEFTSMIAGPDIDGRNRLEQTALVRSDTGRPVGVNVNDVRKAGETSKGLFRQLERDLGSRFDNRLASLQASARTHALRDGGIILGAVVLSFLIMLFVARSMLSPLRTLRTNALGVASTRLPQAVQRILSSDNPAEASRGAVAPVPPFTTEEIGEVARSFDVVHGQAV